MITSRAIVIACSGIMLSLAAGSPLAAAECPPLPGGALCLAATALPQAAEGISKAGDAVAHLTQLSNDAFKYIAVLIDHGRVQDLVKSIAQMNVNNADVVSYLKDYQTYGGGPPPHYSWDMIRSKVTETLRTATEIEGRLNSLSSALVDQHVYNDLEEAIGAKSRVLMSLSQMQAPPKDDPYLNDLLTNFNTYAQAIRDAQKQIQDFSLRLASSR